jgi:ABC-type nitrate/sulfonate/bicarbonate transport system ATPase subunit
MIDLDSVSIDLVDRDGDARTIITDLSLTVTDGEFLTVVGPSGCGKTTVLRALAGLVPASAGTIRIDGSPVTGPSELTAMVFQEFALLPWRSVLRNVELPLEARNLSKAERRARAMAALEKVHLTHAAHRMPRELSGGMKQRVGLARALAVDAKFLLMDEPFGALDPQVKRILQATLLELWQGSTKTVVFVTHDIDEAAILSDRVVCLGSSPGVIREVVEVDVPRPRLTDDLEVTFAMETTAYRDRLWKLLSPDIRRANEVTDGDAGRLASRN